MGVFFIFCVFVMHAAVSTANIDLLKSLLEEKKESVDVIEDKYKETPLHVACSKQKLACCKLLLEHNADPSIVNGNGDTPLHLLINAQEASIPIQERSELIEILLQLQHQLMQKITLENHLFTLQLHEDLPIH